MLTEQIILQILTKIENERTITAPYYLLQGKRSGQTMQDVGLFKLYSFFNLLRRLPKKTYDAYIKQLEEKQYIVQTEKSFFVTEEGKASIQPLPYFDGWHLRGNEHIFFARIALIIQTLSNQSEQVHAFIPVQKDVNVQKWCRQFLTRHQFKTNKLQKPLLQEILESIEKLDIPEFQKEIFTMRLHGAKISGVTWSQLATQFDLSEIDCQLYFISFLHVWIREIFQNAKAYPYLSEFVQDIYFQQTVSQSTFQTAQLYAKGYSLEQISAIRNLKLTTIEDHIVEIALYEQNFDTSQFLTEDEIQQVVQAVEAYDTKKLKVLKEVLPQLSYFQLKLALAKGGV